MKGSIVRKRDEGYGFIKPEDGEKDVFFHASALGEEIDFDSLNIVFNHLAVNYALACYLGCSLYYFCLILYFWEFYAKPTARAIYALPKLYLDHSIVY